VQQQQETKKPEHYRRPRNSRRLSAPFANRVAAVATPDLFYTIEDERGRPVKGVLNLAVLHKMHLHALQKELVDEAALVRLGMSIRDSRIIRQLLREYCK
jgi:hypothetical protein